MGELFRKGALECPPSSKIKKLAAVKLAKNFTCKSGVMMTVPSIALMIEDRFARTMHRIRCMRCTS